jgi:molybdopterin/thiamine biosynthesis adenylyltransferase
MLNWWERFPARLEYEIAKLREMGASVEQDRLAKASNRVELLVNVRVSSEQLSLRIRFPDLYPFFRFEIFAPTLSLSHHQNPILKNLCLINSSTDNWQVTDTVAAFLTDRLPLVLNTGRSESADDVSGIEEQQAEPISTYYPYQKNSTVLVDSSWRIPSHVEAGKMILGIDPSSSPILRGAVNEVLDAGGALLARAHDGILRLHSATVRGRWVRLSRAIVESQPHVFLDKLYREHRSLQGSHWQRFGDVEIDVIGILFPEENGWRAMHDGWLFVFRIRQDNARGFRPGHCIQKFFARPQWSGVNDMFSRVPDLNFLSTKSVGIVGVGCIGAPSALEFARAGTGELNIMEMDVVEAATIVRWPFGIPAVGRAKTEVIRDFIRSNYPYTHVEVWNHKLGDAVGGQPSDMSVLNAFLTGLDLIYDASAEFGVNYFMADIAKSKGIPFVSISSTPGAWGGRIARIAPARTQGCWMCLQYAMQDGSIPAPPYDASGGVQPVGCASPTFTGTSFDVTEVALSGVRLAISTLGEDSSGNYPDFDWDVGVLSLRDVAGRPIPPTWSTHRLLPNPKCECHQI